MSLTRLEAFLTTASAARKPLSWASMGASEKQDFADSFQPNTSFSKEQHAVLNKYYIVIPSQAALDGMNKSISKSYNRLEAVATLSGDLVLPLSLWTDEATWGGAMNALRGMKVVQLSAADFPTPEPI